MPTQTPKSGGQKTYSTGPNPPKSGSQKGIPADYGGGKK